MARQKTCSGCIALAHHGKFMSCVLGYLIGDPVGIAPTPYPLEKCPKPKTYKALTKAIKTTCVKHTKEWLAQQKKNHTDGIRDNNS